MFTNNLSDRFGADTSRQPIRSAALYGTSFIGVWWLLAPLWAQIGWSVNSSRPYLLFVGAFFGAAMTLRARRQASIE